MNANFNKGKVSGIFWTDNIIIGRKEAFEKVLNLFA